MIKNDIDESLQKEEVIEFLTEGTTNLDSIANLVNKKRTAAETNKLKRELHTLKGSMSMLGFIPLSKLIHKLEDNPDDRQVLSTIIEAIKQYKIGNFNYDFTQSKQEQVVEEQDVADRQINKEKTTISYDEIDNLIERNLNLRTSKNNIEVTIDDIFNEFKNLKFKVNNGELDNLHDINFSLGKLFSIFDTKRTLLKHELSTQDTTTQNILYDVFKFRQVSFKKHANLMYKLVDRIAKESNKQVKLHIENENIKFDKKIMDKIIVVIEHLIRNAVVHGIKETGNVYLELRISNNYLLVSVRDDGCGINLEKLKSKAEQLGLRASDYKELIFMSGVSTNDNPDLHSGRGVGLDIVKNIIVSFGGHISVETSSSGTNFLISVPIEQSLSKILTILECDQYYGFPNNIVEHILSFNRETFLSIKQKRSIVFENKTIPLYLFHEIIGLPAPLENKEHYKIIILDFLGDRIAVYVDVIDNNQEVIIKNLGLLNRTDGVIGATILNNGKRCLVLNPVVMVSDKSETQSEKQDYILIVDDSKTVCMMQERVLKRYPIATVSKYNGKAALDYLINNKQDLPVMIITDYEMPIMDGFEMVEAIKNDDDLKNIPVIMVTSKSLEQYRDRAKEIGILEVYGKPFNQTEIFEMIRKHNG